MSKILMNINDFVSFLNKCPTQFHFCSYARSELLKSGFIELKECEEWKEIPTKAFFIRDEREVVAWKDYGHEHAIIAGARCDSPCLILKPNFDEVVGGYRRCKCYTYGSGLWNSWFDRDLRLAGRVLIKNADEDKESVKSMLFDSEVGIAVIPCIAPHLDSKFTYGTACPINENENFIPIYGFESQTSPLLDYIASKLNIDSKDIVSYDIQFVDSDPSYKIFDNEDLIIHSQKLNGLHNTYTVLKSFINSTPEEGTISMIAIFDNEIENKAPTSTASNVLDSTLRRILQYNSSDYRFFKANSFFVNCKSFHAQNPNFAGNNVFREINLGNGICMQRSSIIKSVSSPKNDYSIGDAIKNIFAESKIEKEADLNLDGVGSDYEFSSKFRKRAYGQNMYQQGTYRFETEKEATEDDDQISSGYKTSVFIPDFSTLSKCDDADYPLVSKKIQELNRSFQHNHGKAINSKQENENKNENDNTNKKEEENQNNKLGGNDKSNANENIENKSSNTMFRRGKFDVTHPRNENHFNHPFRGVPSASSSSKDEKDLLGSDVENKFGILSIDIGAPLIGMNSIRELGSFSDIEYEFAILSELFTNYSKYSILL